jgi:hypothetical protein
LCFSSWQESSLIGLASPGYIRHQTFTGDMSPSPEQNPQPDGEAGEKQLCMNCVVPNDPAAHFFVKCGAPLSSYAETGPVESLFAEGHNNRHAAERPRNMIVVLGICLIFGTVALTGTLLIVVGREAGLGYVALGAFGLAISVTIILKTVGNYLAQKRANKKDPIPTEAPPA